MGIVVKSELMRRALLLLGLVLVLFMAGCQHGRDVRSGDRHFSEGRYEEALESYRRAQVRAPDSEKLALKVQETEAKLIDDMEGRLKSLLDAEMYLQAMELAGRGVGLLGERRELVHMNAHVREVVREKVSNDAEREHFSSAMVLLETLSEQGLDPEGTLESLSGSVRAQWVEYLDTQGAEAQGRKLLGRALLMFAKAEELAPVSERRELIGSLYEEWLARYAYRIHFEPPAPRVRRLWDRVVSPLSEYAWPPGLIWSPDLPEELPGGVGAMEFVPPIFKRDQVVTTHSEQYQSGTRLVENPFYKSRLDEVNAQENRVTDAENEVTRREQDVDRHRAEVQRQGDSGNTVTGAQQNLRNAQNRLESARNQLIDERQKLQRARESLSRVPQMEEEPVYSTHVYSVTTHRLMGTLSLRGEFRSLWDREVVDIAEVFEAIGSDTEHDAQPVLNLGAKRLRLPTEADLEPDLYHQGTDRLADVIWNDFSRYRERIRERGQLAGVPEEQADWLAVYLLLDPERRDTSAVLALSGLEGIPNPVAVLQLVSGGSI